MSRPSLEPGVRARRLRSTRSGFAVAVANAI
jgi:hypothetical protein